MQQRRQTRRELKTLGDHEVTDVGQCSNRIAVGGRRLIVWLASLYEGSFAGGRCAAGTRSSRRSRWPKAGCGATKNLCSRVGTRICLALTSRCRNQSNAGHISETALTIG